MMIIVCPRSKSQLLNPRPITDLPWLTYKSDMALRVSRMKTAGATVIKYPGNASKVMIAGRGLMATKMATLQ